MKNQNFSHYKVRNSKQSLLINFILWCIAVFWLYIFSNWAASLGHGYDYQAYVVKIEGYIKLRESGEAILDLLYLAKDILFALTIEISVLFKDRVNAVFTITISLALLTKYLAANKVLGGKRAWIFLLLYILLLAPGLEFAAIRSALAIGLFLLAIAHYSNKTGFWILSLFSIASHASMIISAPFVLNKINKVTSRRPILMFIVIFIVLLVAVSALSHLFVQTEGYKGREGNLLGYIFPIFTTILTLIFFKKNNLDKTMKSLKGIVYGISFSAFPLHLMTASASTRIVQIVLTILLFVGIKNFKYKFDWNTLGLLLLVLFLIAINVIRNTWKAIIDPNFLY